MTIYTCIFGDYDELKEPLVITPGWKYVCYTDRPRESKTWEVRVIHPGNHRTLSKLIKMSQYAEWERSIYIDASFIINCDLSEFWQRYHMPGKVCVMQHPWRNCPYDEIDEIDRTGRDTREVCDANRTRLENAGILPKSGQAATGIILREGHHPFCDEWMQIYLHNGSNRDQVAWALANAVYPDACHRFDFDYRVRTEFLHVPHNSRPKKQAARLAEYRRKGWVK